MIAEIKRACWRRAVAGALALWSIAMPVIGPTRTTSEHARMTAATMSEHAEHGCSHKSGGTPARHQPCGCCDCGCVPGGPTLIIGRPVTLFVSPPIEYAATPPSPRGWLSDANEQIMLPPPLGPPVSRL